MEQINILVIEDDREINRLISEHLNSEGYHVVSTYQGEEGLHAFRSQSFHLVILDLMLPIVDGFEVLKEIREEKTIPVFILSAKYEENDKIRGLGLGADDYMTKPFGLGEFTARVKAQLRRSLQFSGDAAAHSDVLHYLDIEMNTSTYEVTVGRKQVALTAKEFEILKLFLQNPKKVFTKSQIFRTVWCGDYLNDENTVMVHIRRLREKIEPDPSAPSYIKTIWGIGYKLSEDLPCSN